MRLDRLAPFVMLIIYSGYVGPAGDGALAQSHLSGVAVHGVEAEVHLCWRRNSGKF